MSYHEQIFMWKQNNIVLEYYSILQYTVLCTITVYTLILTYILQNYFLYSRSYKIQISTELDKGHLHDDLLLESSKIAAIVLLSVRNFAHTFQAIYCIL